MKTKNVKIKANKIKNKIFILTININSSNYKASFYSTTKWAESKVCKVLTAGKVNYTSHKYLTSNKSVLCMIFYYYC